MTDTIAIIANVFAHHVALRAVLDDIATREVTGVWSVGNVLGHGPEPVQTANMLRNTFAKQARDQQRGWLHSRGDEVLLDRQLRDSLVNTWDRHTSEKMAGDPVTVTWMRKLPRETTLPRADVMLTSHSARRGMISIDLQDAVRAAMSDRARPPAVAILGGDPRLTLAVTNRPKERPEQIPLAPEDPAMRIERSEGGTVYIQPGAVGVATATSHIPTYTLLTFDEAVRAITVRFVRVPVREGALDSYRFPAEYPVREQADFLLQCGVDLPPSLFVARQSGRKLAEREQREPPRPPQNPRSTTPEDIDMTEVAARLDRGERIDPAVMRAFMDRKLQQMLDAEPIRVDDEDEDYTFAPAGSGTPRARSTDVDPGDVPPPVEVEEDTHPVTPIADDTGPLPVVHELEQTQAELPASIKDMVADILAREGTESDEEIETYVEAEEPYWLNNLTDLKGGIAPSEPPDPEVMASMERLLKEQAEALLRRTDLTIDEAVKIAEERWGEIGEIEDGVPDDQQEPPSRPADNSVRDDAPTDDRDPTPTVNVIIQRPPDQTRSMISRLIDAVNSVTDRVLKGQPQAKAPVRFSAFYPQTPAADAENSLLVYVHLESAVEQVKRDANQYDPSDETTLPRAPRKNTQIAHGTPVTIVPESEVLAFEPHTVRKTWAGDWMRFQMTFNAPVALAYRSAQVRVSIQIHGIEISHIKLTMDVRPPRRPLASERSLPGNGYSYVSTRPYNQIFLSYSNRDHEVVDAVASVQQALGDTTFIDTQALRNQPDWKTQMAQAIDNAESFQLFWSENSALSRHCRREWSYAVATRCAESNCEDFIRLVYWRKPVPYPPEELAGQGFHFIPLLQS